MDYSVLEFVPSVFLMGLCLNAHSCRTYAWVTVVSWLNLSVWAIKKSESVILWLKEAIHWFHMRKSIHCRCYQKKKNWRRGGQTPSEHNPERDSVTDWRRSWKETHPLREKHKQCVMKARRFPPDPNQLICFVCHVLSSWCCCGTLNHISWHISKWMTSWDQAFLCSMKRSISLVTSTQLQHG